MSDSPNPSVLDDLDDLPALVAPDGNLFHMLANCYTLCRMFRVDLGNILRNRADLNNQYDFSKRQFKTILDRVLDVRRPSVVKDLRELRGALGAANRDAALVQCAALLRALSLHIADEVKGPSFGTEPVSVSPRLGGGSLLISRKIENAIAERCKKRPRIDNDVSETLARYHWPLEISPAQVDRWSLVRCLLPRVTSKLMTDRLERNNVKIATTPFALDARIRGYCLSDFPSNQAAHFRVSSVGDLAAQTALLDTIFSQCRNEGISILVLPELRVPPVLLDAIRRLLREQPYDELESGRGLLLVVAGSWHHEEDGRCSNRCVVLDSAGDTVWVHDKLAEFNITPENVKESPILKDQLGINDHGGVEAITVGRTLEFCDTPLGRLCVTICVGFFHQPLEQVLISSGANIFLVPAMTPKTERLKDRAHALVGSQHAATFVANCGAVASRGGTKPIEPDASSFYLIPEARAEPIVMDSPLVTGRYLHIFPLTDL